MKRRDLLAACGSAVAIAPLGARAQQPAMPVIGFLHTGAPEQNVKRVASFRKGLAEAGFVEDRNVAIDFRWTLGQNAALPELATELARKPVAVIVTLSSTLAAVAARNATKTVPIYFLIADPPVELGLVQSLNRPGGNATGIVSLSVEIMAKRFALLREMVPKATTLAVLVNPGHPSAKAVTDTLRTAAGTLGVPFQVLEAVTDAEIEVAYAALKPNSALMIATDPSFFIRRAKLIALSARHAVPTIYDNREFAVDGGLITYGADIESLWGDAGTNVARILKGQKPADLPVVQASKLELMINLKTAKTLGIDVPGNLMALASDTVE